MKYTPKFGGWVPDHKQLGDHTDYSFNELAVRLTPSVSSNAGILDLRHLCSPVENQGHLGSCVGNAVVGGLELLQNVEGIPFQDLSRLFIYYNSRLMHQSQDKDEGTFIRLAMGTLSAIGTCQEKLWPYDTSKVFVRPTWGCYRNGYANKINGYYRINEGGNDRISAIRHALSAKHPVVFGMTVDLDYMQVGNDGIVAMPKSVRQNPGGHAQLIVGDNANTERLIVRNSWGSDWGDHGFCHLPYAYLDESDANDFWVPTLTITGK